MHSIRKFISSKFNVFSVTRILESQIRTCESSSPKPPDTYGKEIKEYEKNIYIVY